MKIEINITSNSMTQTQFQLLAFVGCACMCVRIYTYKYKLTHTCACMLSYFSHVRLFVTHGLWPSRLLSPWDSPGNNTAVGCHAHIYAYT